MAIKGDPGMTTNLAVIALSAVIMIGGGWMVLKKSPNLGPNTLQAIGIILLLPTLLILAVTKALDNLILATLLGGFVGFIFARSSDGRK